MRTKPININDVLNDSNVKAALIKYFENYFTGKEFEKNNDPIISIKFHENNCTFAPLNVECLTIESNLKAKPVLAKCKNKNGKGYFKQIKKV